MGEHRFEREIGVNCAEREIWGNIVLRERLGELCAKGDIVEKMCSERDWGTLC